MKQEKGLGIHSFLTQLLLICIIPVILLASIMIFVIKHFSRMVKLHLLEQQSLKVQLLLT